MLKKILRDKEFVNATLQIAIPVTIQSLIASSLNTLDTFMITKLGTAAIAGVGLANQVFFFFSFFLFGLNTGSAILFSQFNGREDYKSVRKTMILSLKYSFVIALIFNICALTFPHQIIALFIADDPMVIEAGVIYLRAVSSSYIVTALSFAFGVAMRSTGNPRTPLMASIISFFANAFFNYCFIFGKFGMPELGVLGAAVGTIIARFIELGVYIFVVVKYKGPLYFKIRDFFKTDFKFFKNFSLIVIPVILEEILWSFAQVLYNFFYAKTGVDSTAAVQVAFAVSNMLYIFARGLSSATAVVVGTKIGEGDLDRAQDMADKSIIASLYLGAFLGIILILARKYLLLLFDLTPEVRQIAMEALVVMGIFYPIKTANSTIVVGVVRGGGDIKYSLVAETSTAYLIGVPMAYLGAIVLGWPLYGVMVLISLEEVAKLLVTLPRTRNKKWIRRLAA